MKSELRLSIKLTIIFLLFSALAFGINAVLNHYGYFILYRLHFVFFFLHFVSLLTVFGIGLVQKNMMGYIYMLFLILKMITIIFVIYQFPEFEKDILKYFIVYWYYLMLETILVVFKINKEEKNHKINTHNTL